MTIVGYGTTMPRRNAPPGTTISEMWDGKRRIRISTLRRVVDETWGALVDTQLRLLRRLGWRHFPESQSNRGQWGRTCRQRERWWPRLPPP